jgi:hypothetical protein
MVRLAVLIVTGALGWWAGPGAVPAVPAAAILADQAPPRPLVEALGAIFGLPQYTAFDWVGGRYSRGTLTLEGFAARPGLREEAVRVARSIGGVDDIDNQIELLPSIQSDDTLRIRAYVAVYTHPGLEQYTPGGSASALALREVDAASHFGLDATPQFRGPHPIHIVVSGGRVQLFGSVNVSGDRRIAEAELRTLTGVMSVVNRIQVRK